MSAPWGGLLGVGGVEVAYKGLLGLLHTTEMSTAICYV